MMKTRSLLLALLASLPLYTATAQTTAKATTPTPHRIFKTEADWRKVLTPEQFAITRKAGTERPFTSPLVDNHEKGQFRCVCCHTPLFSSGTKFESGTGWPSFYQALSPTAVKEKRDESFGSVRTEVLCATCDAHLGHVFDDGPKPTGLRYCMNGVALEFAKAK